ncbi:MAG: transposase [Betaproteobacteria bacterium]|nr:transposase [Betaproteobacteria bacterium]NCP81062.1 transposase [Rhodoferax sp.]NCS61832.1 transposase [Rhodoferax sp.]
MRLPGWRITTDKNWVERDMRGSVVGRKNFYGSGSKDSGELATDVHPDGHP